MLVIDSVAPDHVPATATADARLVWIGEDDRGIDLEIVAVDFTRSSTGHRRPQAGPLPHLPSGRFWANSDWVVWAAMAKNLTRTAGVLA